MAAPPAGTQLRFALTYQSSLLAPIPPLALDVVPALRAALAAALPPGWRARVLCRPFSSPDNQQACLEVAITLGWEVRLEGGAEARALADLARLLSREEAGGSLEPLASALFCAGCPSPERYLISRTTLSSAPALVEAGSPTRAAPPPPPPLDAGAASWGLDWEGELSRHLTGAGVCLALTILSLVLDSACGPGRCLVVGAPVGQWLRLAGFAALVSPPSTLLDMCVFVFMEEAARRLGLHSTVVYYIKSLEGGVGRLAWLLACEGYNQLLLSIAQGGAGVDQTAMGGMLAVMASYQVLSMLRTFYLRWYTRTYLLRSLQGKMNGALFAAFLALALSVAAREQQELDEAEGAEGGAAAAAAAAGRGSAGSSSGGSSALPPPPRDALARVGYGQAAGHAQAQECRRVLEEEDLQSKADAIAAVSGLEVIDPRLGALVQLGDGPLSAADEDTALLLRVAQLAVLRLEGAFGGGRGGADAAAASAAAAAAAAGGGRARSNTIRALGGGEAPGAAEGQPAAAAASAAATLRTSSSLPEITEASAAAAAAAAAASLAHSQSQAAAASSYVGISSSSISSTASTSKRSSLPAGWGTAAATSSSSATAATTMPRPTLPTRAGSSLSPTSAAAAAAAGPELPRVTRTVGRSSSSSFLRSIAASTVANIMPHTPTSPGHGHHQHGFGGGSGSGGSGGGGGGGGSSASGSGSEGSAAAAAAAAARALQRRAAKVRVTAAHLALLLDGGEGASALGAGAGAAGPAAAPPSSMDYAQRALDYLGNSREKWVSVEEVFKGLKRAAEDLQSLRQNLDGHGGAVAALELLVDVFFALLFSLSVCLAFGLDVLNILVPLGTILVSTSFAIGPSFVQVINSLVFVLITHPYDIGDVVSVGELLPNDILKVTNIDVLTSTFEVVTSGKMVLVPNTRLNSSLVENWSRNPSRQASAATTSLSTALVRMDFTVHSATSKAQLDALQGALEAYVLAHKGHWKEGIILRVVSADASGLHLCAFAFSKYRWCDMGVDPKSGNIYKEKYNIYVKLMESLQELKMVFRLPEQELAVTLRGGLP